MLLTISTTHRPATDLGYLLHKHPDRVQEFGLSVGQARIFYPEASEERTTMALLLEIDPVGLVRRGSGSRSHSGFALAEYVNDRPYVASSFMSVAMNATLRSAMNGTCTSHPELAATPIPLQAHLPSVPARGGEEIVRRLFDPLGYETQLTTHPLDPNFPEWGDARHASLTVSHTIRLKDLLSHLYVLLPVLDDEKHYWVGEDEIEKLLKHGEGWLSGHPARELIVRRYLRRRHELTSPALERLAESDPPPVDAGADEPEADEPEERVRLSDQRIGTVLAALKASGAKRVLDLGCGPGALLQKLMREDYERIVGTDVSMPALQIAARRLKLDRLHDAQRERIELIQSPLTYRDRRLQGFDAAVLMEVIEHLDPPRLSAAERNVFGSARPGTVIVTTPNAEYNVRWETLPAGSFRHRDHRFEWTRAQFAQWTSQIQERYGYDVRLVPVGPDDPEVGPPTQMAVFTR